MPDTKIRFELDIDGLKSSLVGSFPNLASCENELLAFRVATAVLRYVHQGRYENKHRQKWIPRLKLADKEIRSAVAQLNGVLETYRGDAADRLRRVNVSLDDLKLQLSALLGDPIARGGVRNRPKNRNLERFLLDLADGCELTFRKTALVDRKNGQQALNADLVRLLTIVSGFLPKEHRLPEFATLAKRLRDLLRVGRLDFMDRAVDQIVALQLLTEGYAEGSATQEDLLSGARLLEEFMSAALAFCTADEKWREYLESSWPRNR